MTNYIVGTYALPKSIQKEIKKETNEIKKNFMHIYRHLTEVEYHSYQKRLDKQVPKKAPTWE